MKQTETHYILTTEERDNDLITSYHGSMVNGDLPDLLEDIQAQLKYEVDKSVKLDLMVYKQKVEGLLEISRKLGNRKYSFE